MDLHRLLLYLRFMMNPRLHVAALILAVRTARFEDHDFEGAGTPRMAGAVGRSIAIADKLMNRVEEQRPEWLKDI